MRVIPLTSVLSHKGRGCRCAKWDETLSLEVMELIKQALRRGPIFDASQSAARDWVRAARARAVSLTWRLPWSDSGRLGSKLANQPCL